MSSSSRIAAIAASPLGRKLSTRSKFMLKQEENRLKQNRIKREKLIVADIEAQADCDEIYVMQQSAGDWFYGITHDYDHFALSTARRLHPDKDVYIYRTDESYIELSHTETGETYPPLDISVKLTKEARRAYLRIAKDDPRTRDQCELVRTGFDGCACTYFASRFVNLHCLEKYGGAKPNQLIMRPIYYHYPVSGDVERFCVDTSHFGQGSGSQIIRDDIEPTNDYEQRLLNEIIKFKEWT